MSNLIDMFGAAIDDILEEADVRMVVRLPEGSMEAKVMSPFTQEYGPVLDFYILLHGLTAVVSDLMSMRIVDPDKEEYMIDSILELVKAEILQRDKNGD